MLGRVPVLRRRKHDVDTTAANATDPSGPQGRPPRSGQPGMQRLQRFPRLLDNLHTELSNKDIAEHLFVSPRTVQAHLSHA